MRHSLFATLLALGIVLTASVSGTAQRPPQPHIVFILADDLGWSDVGWHGSETRTPHLDRLATSGARLEQFYALPVCTPTRAALLTGRYPIRYGLQAGVNRPWSQWGLPLNERLLPQALKQAGYRTAITGKWHLGHADRAYLPTRRGFDHQYGHYTGAIDYFTHTRLGGFDWHRNDRPLREDGYSTELIGREAVRLIEQHDPDRPLFLYVPFNAPHSPLQAPQEYLDRYLEIRDRRRRTYAAMVSCLDDQVGRIAAALERRGMRENTLLIFSSDNGGPLALGATNGRLRGGKATLYEGGVRVPAFAAWPGRLKPSVVDEPLHMVDWYPTLLRLAGARREQKLPQDGRDMWRTLAAGRVSPHAEILLNVEPDRGAIRQGPWKLVVEGPLPRPANADPFAYRVGLFNLAEDPEERFTLAGQLPGKAEELTLRLDHYARQAAPPKGGTADRQPADWKVPAEFGEPG